MKNRQSILTQLSPYRSQLLRLRFSLLCLISTFQLCFSQITPISGIINSYYRVVEVLPAKACLRLNSTSGLNYNDKVMIVQMKGVTINTSNSTSFGDVTNLNDAGNYEIATVCHVEADSLFLVYTLLNQYSVAGKVQVVKIPQYYSAIVTDTLKPAPWNNSTGTGGVLAISVEEDLTLNAPLFADSSGFRGGAFMHSGSGCSNFFPTTDYYYDANASTPTTQNGAFKGEGVVDIAAAQSGGRGSLANGGGGGNNHNNGGAGGANLSAGGVGGGNSSSSSSVCRGAYEGLGGRALSSSGGAKIFLGGGGGAGHANNALVVSNGGGHGGGLVFVEAKNLAGLGYTVSARGQRGGPAISDGASGGGAGGTIIMNVTNYIGALTVSANGGQGGTENDNGNVGRCYGAGGGGSGGAIYFSTAAPAVAVTVSGGAAGTEIGRDATCFAAVLPLPGSVGQIIPNYNYSTSNLLESSYCAYILPVELTWFKAIYANSSPLLSWKVTDPALVDRFIIEKAGNRNNWIAVHEQSAKEDISVYTFEDLFPASGNNYYRLKIIGKDKQVLHSSILKVFIPTRNDPVNIFPNPAHKKITVTGNISFIALNLFDLSGKLLFQKNNNSNQNSMEIELPDLPRGVYILKIGTAIKKLIIQ